MSRGGADSAVARTVTAPMTIVIHRVIAAYCLFALIPSLPAMVAQMPTTALWWRLLFLPLISGSLVAMVVGSVLRRSIAGLAGFWSVVCLVAFVTGLWAFAPPPGAAPWLWWEIVPAVVCAALCWRTPGALIYAGVGAVAYALLRTRPQFGAESLDVAVGDAIYMASASLPIALVALGMITAGEAADRLAARVVLRETEEAVGEALSEERGRLDRIIHDDVMTILTMAAQAQDESTVRHTADLARASLGRIDELDREVLDPGPLSGDVVIRLLQEAVTRVSPVVGFTATTAPTRWAVELTGRQSEALIAAAREAVRNAVRHSGASRIEVSINQAWAGERAELVVVVRDDGQGFALDSVPADRLGVRQSIQARLREQSISSTIESVRGLGTEVTMRATLSRREELSSAPVSPAPAGLPAEFPTRLLVGCAWGLIASQVGMGLFYLDEMAVRWLSVVAIAPMAVASALVLHSGSTLTMGLRSARITGLLAVAAVLTMTLGLSLDRWPGYASWVTPPLQVVLVVLVLRGRARLALAVAAVSLAVLVGWAVQTRYVVMAVLSSSFVISSYVLGAIFVRRGLLDIAGRQAQLREQEQAALRGTARRRFAQLQRALWVADLRNAVRPILTTIAQAERQIDREVQGEALIIEATLRESMRARNVMSEELGALTELARRRGVSVTVVDSRNTPAGRHVNRAVLLEVQDALADGSVSRIVIRVAPDGAAELASVVRADAGGARLVSIRAEGSEDA